MTNEFYIGSTCKLQSRKSAHRNELKKGIHHSPILQASFNKYGIENFVFIELIECDNTDKLILENYYIKNWNPDFNISKDSTAPMEGRKHSIESRVKMASWKRKKGKDHHNYGNKASAETKIKMSESRTGLKRNEITKAKMSETAKRIQSIARIDRTKYMKKISDNLGNIFISLSEAARHHGVSVQTVCDILKGRHFKTRNGVIFSYA